jgi:D-glycero-D-manno-heptose 1,7-bisphosphate phosphatase
VVKRRAAFLDRDGVINVPPAPGEYIVTPDQFQLLPNVADWIRILNALRILVIVVTNQRGVALGVTAAEDLHRIHSKMRDDLSRRGAVIDDVFVCPHEEDMCQCRKPKPGMVIAARDKWDIDLVNSLLIGDSERDRQLAEVCGLTFLEVVDGRVHDVHRYAQACESQTW